MVLAWHPVALLLPPNRMPEPARHTILSSTAHVLCMHSIRVEIGIKPVLHTSTKAVYLLSSFEVM